MYRTPLLNIMVSSKNLPVEVLELVYCQGNLVDFGKKYGTLICYIYFEYMRTIDPDKSITDVVMLD